MRFARAESLWHRALTAALAQGIVASENVTLTPAEIGRASGDVRLKTLVAGYYYPARYGRAAGTLSESEAEALVASLEAAMPRRSGQSDELAEGTSGGRCSICGIRAAEEKQHG